MSPDAVDSVTLTEADMNDPDLNAELAAVLGESVPSRPAATARAPEHGSDSDAALRQQISAKKKLALQLRATDKPAAMQALREAKQLEAALQARPPPPTVPPPAGGAGSGRAASAAAGAAAAAARSLRLEADADSVTLTEADMDDPDLNAELAAVLGEPVPTPQRRPAAAARAPDDGSDSEAALRQQISAKKKLALQLRATDKPAAMQALREAKQLEAALKARPPPPGAPPPAAAAARRVGLEAAGVRGASGGPEHVTLSEADMHDPELLAELAAITGANPNPTLAGDTPGGAGAGGGAASPPMEHRRAAAAAAEVEVEVEGGEQAGSDDELSSLVQAMSAPAPPPPQQERARSP